MTGDPPPVPGALRRSACAVLVVLAAAGCPDAPPSAREARGPTPVAPPAAASPPSPPVTPPAPAPPGTPAPPPVSAPAEPEADLAPEPVEGHVFALPDPLPPEASPVAHADRPPGEPGPPPLALWVGGTGVEPGLLRYPRGLAATAEGHALVIDKTGRIQRFDLEGRLVASVRMPEVAQGQPTGLKVAPDGRVLAADTHYARVVVFGPDLRLERAFGEAGRAPGRFMLLSCALRDPGGALYTTDYGDDVARVQAFAPDGRHRWSTGSFGLEPGHLRRPMSLCLDRDGARLWVADAVNHRVVVLAAADGRWLGHWGEPGRARGQLGFPYDLEQDEDGRLWVAEFGNQRVSVFEQDGRCVGAWGAPGRRLGELARPWGLALAPGGRVWVLDSQNDRLYLLPRAAVLDPRAE